VTDSSNGRQHPCARQHLRAGMQKNGLIFWMVDTSTMTMYNFISHVQTEMLLYGNGIHDAIQNAATDYWDVVFSFNWVNQMEVYGFWDLHFSQYND
jgi:hypothetical protein